MSGPERTLVAAALIVGALFIGAAYGPDLGRGFVKDDSTWIVSSREGLRDVRALFRVDSSGFFFRPAVAASFAADYGLYGVHARGYGITNLLLTLACAAVLVRLFRTLGVRAGAAAVGALVWTINPHGIGMALLWISGRTSLLMTLFSVLTMVFVLEERRPLGALCLLAALFAKEDALAVPLIAIACRAASAKGATRRALIADALWMSIAVAVYVALRMRTPAMTPATAPWYYQLTSSPSAIAVNVLSYLDRALTGATVLTVAAIGLYRAMPRFTRSDRRLLMVAALWFAAGLAITVRIPVRSDLYAVFPSIGGALAAAVTIDALRARAGAHNADRRLAWALVALLALVPVYRVRNGRFVEPARLSGLVQRQLASDAVSLPASGTIVFQDEVARFSTFGDAFDGMATNAVRLFTGHELAAEIVPSQDSAPRPSEVARYRLTGGSVTRVR